MADVVAFRQDSIFAGQAYKPYKRAFANVAAAQTDAALIAAVPNKRIVVIAVTAENPTGATTMTFNTKPAGAGTAISPTLGNVTGNTSLAFNSAGWFQTNVGEGLTVTTGAGATQGILVIYIEL